MLDDILQGMQTSYGWGYYETLLRCPKEAQLSRQLREENEGAEPDYSEVSLGFQAGTIYHLLLEKYHKEPEPFKVSDVDLTLFSEAAQSRAVPAFGAYRARFERKAWGRIVSVEETLEGSIQGVPVSIKPDLLVHVGSRSVDRVRKDTRTPGITAGTWIMDWKLYNSFDPRTIPYFRDGIRTLWYRSVYNVLHETPCAGMITHVQCCKTRKFTSIVNGPVTPRERMRFQALLNEIRDAREDPYPYRPQSCIGWNRRCAFYGNGCLGFQT